MPDYTKANQLLALFKERHGYMPSVPVEQVDMMLKEHREADDADERVLESIAARDTHKFSHGRALSQPSPTADGPSVSETQQQRNMPRIAEGDEQAQLDELRRIERENREHQGSLMTEDGKRKAAEAEAKGANRHSEKDYGGAQGSDKVPVQPSPTDESNDEKEENPRKASGPTQTQQKK